MNEFQAAMGLCNLRHVDENIRARKHVHDLYMALLGGHEGITLPISQADVEGCYVYFPVLFDGGSYKRDEVFDRLTALDIHTRKYFYPLITDFECYRGMDGFDSSATPIAKSVSDQILTLPLYPDLADEDVRRICAGILERRYT